jgi:hypothetical protein
MRFKTRSHHTHTLTTDEGHDVELAHAPNYENDILVEVVGDKLVVAYLVHDDSPSNPMDGHAQGNFYTLPSRYGGGGSITDDADEIYAALGCDLYGDVDIDKQFSCAPYIDHRGIMQKVHSLRDIAALQFLGKVGSYSALIRQWLEERDLELDEGETLEQAYARRYNEIWQDLEDCFGVFSEEVEAQALLLYSAYWQEIVSPFVVPCYYCRSNHGPGTMSISVADWDGDPDDLPNAIWVADEGCIENITEYPPGITMEQVQPYPDSVYAVAKEGVENYRGTWAECKAFIKDFNPPPGAEGLRTAAAKYAESICADYQSWCNGDVYGCVTEIFQVSGPNTDSEWEQVEYDACWGFIGHDNATEALKGEYFDSVIARLKPASSADAAGKAPKGGPRD